MNDVAKMEHIAIPEGEATLFANIRPFVLKVLLVAIVFFGGISFMLPNLHDLIVSVQNEVRKDQNKLRLTGLFTTNPAVHMKVSYLREEAGDIKGAMMEIELAIGLLELHSAEHAVTGRYQARLDELRKKLPKPESTAQNK